MTFRAGARATWKRAADLQRQELEWWILRSESDAGELKKTVPLGPHDESRTSMDDAVIIEDGNQIIRADVYSVRDGFREGPLRVQTTPVKAPDPPTDGRIHLIPL